MMMMMMMEREGGSECAKCSCRETKYLEICNVVLCSLDELFSHITNNEVRRDESSPR